MYILGTVVIGAILITLKIQDEIDNWMLKKMGLK